MPEPSAPLRVVFTSAGALGTGMTAAAICEAGIEAVGFIHDVGPLRLTARSTAKTKPPRYKSAYHLLRLAIRYPRRYVPQLLSHFGYQPTPVYTKYRRVEDAIIQQALHECGEAFRPELTQIIRSFPTLSEIAQSHDLPLHRVQNLNNEESAALIQSMNPDVIVSLGDRIIKSNILQIPRLGVLNGHASLLPRFRGTTTEFWQLVAGEKETGVTIHWMAPRVDEGAIVVQEKWAIPDGATHWEMRAVSQFMRLGAWRKAIRLVQQGFLGTPQPKSQEETYPQPRLVDEYDFYIRHRDPRKS